MERINYRLPVCPVYTTRFFRSVPLFIRSVPLLTCSVNRPGGTPIWFGWGCADGFAKALPFTRPNFANFVTLYQTKNAQLFLISVFCERSRKRDPILDQFPMITRPYTRPNGMKTIPFPAAHTRKANI